MTLMLLQARAALRTALDAVLPPRCLKCGDLLGGENGLCAPCWQKLAWLSSPCCACCGQPFQFESSIGSLILGFKHADRTELAPSLARWMARSGAELIADCALIVPVPLHWTRLALRRFNQAGLLAQAIARLTDRPVEPQALTRKRATRSQGHLSRQARRRNVQGAMAVTERLKPLVAGRRILLVDDVITTGATAETAAKALISAGAVAVDVIALAKVVRAD
jgi:ComF family protein